MAKKKSIYNPRAAEQKQVQAEAEALEVLLAGFSKEAIAAVLSKRADVAELLPQKKPKQDKMRDALETSAPHPKCPACGSSAYQHYGKDRRGFPRYKCTACGRTYGLSANSLVANSSWSYDVWVSFIYHTLMEHSLAQTKQALEEDHGFYTTEATLLRNRHRLFQFIALRWPMPKLNGVVKIDETFFRESQKGSLHLINVSPKYIEKWIARVPERKVPSEFGIAGPEFCCVVAGIDTVGHIVAVVTGLGRNTAAPFGEYFSEYLGNVDILCTDGYKVYSQYCTDHNLVHYVQVSKWRDTLKAEREVYKERYGKELSEEDARKRLYGKQVLDYIENYPRRLSYEEFEQLKADKKLTLNRIDAVHGRMKRYINSHMAGVSTVNLPAYMAFYCFRHNWGVDHGHQPPSSEKAAAEIFKELLSVSCAPQNREKKATLMDMEVVPISDFH